MATGYRSNFTGVQIDAALAFFLAAISAEEDGIGLGWLTGTDVPSADIGSDGCFYLHTPSYNVYKKTGGAWGDPILNIKGVACKLYPTLSDANDDVANIPEGSVVLVDSDPVSANNGFWAKSDGVLTQSNYKSGVIITELDSTNDGETLYPFASFHVDTTTAPFTNYLPASPSVGDHIQIHDTGNNFGINSYTLDNNGNLVNGINDVLECDASGAVLDLYFEGGVTGWRLIQKSNSVVVGSTDWISYTPAWTASTTNPSIGNGVLKGRYKYLDSKTVAIRIHLKIGSTTNTGSGTWSFSLPSGVVAPNDGMTQVLAAGCQDAGADNKLCLAKVGPNSSHIDEITPESGNVVTSASPMTWAANDALYVSGMIETA